jgi:gluconolactonase
MTTESTNLTILANGLRFPEGPIAMPDGSVILVEIESGHLTRVAADGAKTVIANCGDGPNGAAIGPDGKCYICNNGGFNWQDSDGYLRPIGQSDDYKTGRIERVDLDTGKIETLYTRVGDYRLNGPNDIVFDRHGGFWFTDLGKVRETDRDVGAVYYALPDGKTIRRVIAPLLTPNGIGLSPDGSILYVAETASSRLWSYDVTAPGEVDIAPWPSPNGGRLIAGLPGFQGFDSLAVDSAGNICVATLFDGGISVVSPDGNSVEHVEMPDRYCTNICFGGPDLSTAYITLAGTGRLVSMQWPRPGLPLHYLNDEME